MEIERMTNLAPQTANLSPAAPEGGHAWTNPAWT